MSTTARAGWSSNAPTNRQPREPPRRGSPRGCPTPVDAQPSLTPHANPPVGAPSWLPNPRGRPTLVDAPRETPRRGNPCGCPTLVVAQPPLTLAPSQARFHSSIMSCTRSGESPVGKLIVTIAVGDQQGTQFEDIEVTVDTGSTFTAVPGTLLQRLGVPVGRSARSRLADGSAAPVDLGWTMIRLEGHTFPTPVIFAEENQPSLLGVVALEEALLAVDPVGQRLVPVDVMRL